MSRGKLVPSTWVTKLAKEAINQTPGNQGLIFDGFARLLVQAKAMVQSLKKADRRMTAVFLIDISTKETVKRLSERRQCANGHIFRLGVNLKPGIKRCPQCGRPLFQRQDDRPAVIRERLRIYRQKTAPIADYFQKQGLLIKINGEQPIKKVSADILKNLK